MAISTSETAREFLNIVADVEIPVPFPLFAQDEVFVYYGNAGGIAAQGTDYTVELQPDEFNTFNITPTDELLAKINALVAGGDASANRIVVRRTLDLTTNATPGSVQNTRFTSCEFDRVAMKLMQLREGFDRALTLGPDAVGQPGGIIIKDRAPNKALVWDSTANAVTYGDASSGGGGGGGGDGGDAATLNGQPGSYYLDRSTHTGTQSISTVNGLADALTELHDMFASINYDINNNLGIKLDTTTVSGQVDYEFFSPVPLDAENYIEVYLAGGRLVPEEHYTITSGGTNNVLRFTTDPEGAYRVLVFGAILLDAVSGEGGGGPSTLPATAITYSGDVPDSTTVQQALDKLIAIIDSIDTGGGGGTPVTTFSAWPSGRTRTLQERSKFVCHIADFTGPHLTNDNTAAIIEWARQGQAAGAKLTVGSEGTGPRNDFLLSREIEITRAGQVIEFENSGGYAYGENIGGLWVPGTRFIVVGGSSGWFNTTGKRIRTRRLHRANSESPQDAPMSAAINVQAEGVKLIRPCVWLDCDYTDMSPSNLGAYCDVGIFIGCRVGVQMQDPQVIGYFRRAGVYLDVTGMTNAPRHLSVAGTPYLDGSVRNGADGFHMWNPYIRGGRIGLAVLGSKPKAGTEGFGDDYYDAQLGAAITDRRGSFGASDLEIFGGKVYGPDHHSNNRLANPVLSGGSLNQTSLNSEPDDKPAAMYIDGMNGAGRIWGMRFNGTRFATFEAFRVRLGRQSRAAFYSCHIEGRNGGRNNVAGTEIDTNNYTLHCYGDIAGTANTERAVVWGTVRSSIADIAPHYYGPTGVTYLAESGRMGIGKDGFIANDYDELDLRSKTGTGVRFRSGSSSIGVIPPAGIYGTTVGGAANVNVSSNNTLARSSSSIRFKTDIEDMDPEMRKDIVRKLRAIWYRSTSDNDRLDWSWWGLLAEEVAEVDPRLATYDDDGTPSGVMYDRIAVLLLGEVQELNIKYEALDARVAKLEGN